MTSDFNAPTSEALRAETSLQSKASLRLVDDGSRHGAAIYNDAFDALMYAVSGIATHKNVPLKPRYHADIVRDALRMLSHDEMGALVAADTSAIKKARFALSHALDVLAAAMLAHLVLHMRGVDKPQHATIASVVQASLPVNGNGDCVYVWPDLMEAALQYAHAEHGHE